MNSVTQMNATTLQFGDSELDFQHRISKWFEIDGLIVVHFSTRDYAFGDPLVGRNVIALNRKGEFVWRIESSGLTATSRVDRKTIVPQAVLSIVKSPRSGNLSVRFQQITATVDIETGKLIDWVMDIK